MPRTAQPRSAQDSEARRTRTYHTHLGRVPRLAGNHGGRGSTSTPSQHRDAECDRRPPPQAVGLKDPCLCPGSSRVHSVGLQFSVKPAGNSIRDTNPYLNTGKPNHCPLDAVNAAGNADVSPQNTQGWCCGFRGGAHSRRPPLGREDEESPLGAASGGQGGPSQRQHSVRGRLMLPPNRKHFRRETLRCFLTGLAEATPSGLARWSD